jgi:hypothetical protein
MSSRSANSRFRIIPIVLAQGFAVLCGVAGVKLNSHLIPPDVLGAYGVFLTLAPIGMWVVHAGLVKFVIRHWAAAPSRAGLARDVVARWARRLPWLAVVALPGALFTARLTPAADAITVSAGLFGSAALLAFSALAQSALQAEGAHWRDCAVSMSGSVSRTFAPPLLFMATGGAIAALWLGFGMHTFLTAIVALCALRMYWKMGDATTAGQLPFPRAYSGPMFVSLAAAGWTLAGLNRWIVAGFFGQTEAGYFTLAGGAAVVLASTFGAVFVQYLQPGIFALADISPVNRPLLARRVDFIALAYTAAGLIAIGTLAWCGPWLVGPLINESYRASLRWILPAGCFGVATISMVFFQSLLLACRRESACAPVELSSAAVLVIGCITSAVAGREWFERWLIATPILPWLLTRSLTRFHVLKSDEVAAPALAR